ncbi:MAG: MvaI/BcnI family restriction endonuclease [Candidatus Reddybacter sp.]
MNTNIAWSNPEIDAAVLAYFELLQDQVNVKPTNKAEIYRNLSAAHPSRTAKSFEFKFQNISAVLYEEKLPYADGLRPKPNYQTALKDAVLNHLKRTSFEKQAPIDVLTGKLKRLYSRDYLPIQGKGSGRYGLSLEHYLSIPQNSSKEADFMGIELKTKYGKTLQTLFSRVPSRYLACKDKHELLEKFGYYDERKERQALYTSFNNTADSLGFYLSPNKNTMTINKKKLKILEYDNSLLEDAVLSKHNETAYISVSIDRQKNGDTRCRFDRLLYCKTPSLFRFIRMAHDGNIYLDFTLSKKHGRTRDHGFLWRIPQDAIGNLYQETQLIDLSENDN